MSGDAVVTGASAGVEAVTARALATDGNRAAHRADAFRPHPVPA